MLVVHSSVMEVRKTFFAIGKSAKTDLLFKIKQKQELTIISMGNEILLQIGEIVTGFMFLISKIHSDGYIVMK